MYASRLFPFISPYFTLQSVGLHGLLEPGVLTTLRIVRGNAVRFWAAVRSVSYAKQVDRLLGPSSLPRNGYRELFPRR